MPWKRNGISGSASNTTWSKMEDIKAFLERAAKRTGFKREYFLEKNLPTLASNIVVYPLFGDIRTTFVLSSVLMNRFKDAGKGKYHIMASWPGMRGLFPYMDEYWSISDNSLVKSIALNANNFYNDASVVPEITRSFIEVFSDVRTLRDVGMYYKDGFEQTFWDEFKDVYRFLPDVPSENTIKEDFRTQVQRREGRKIFMFPVKKMRTWQKGRNQYINVPKDFWLHLIDRMLGAGLMPVIYQNFFTYDLSPDLADKCIYFTSPNISDVLCAMSFVGCVLDVFSGISRLAISARTPFVCVDERARFVGHKEYEIDDLCCDFLPRQYVFSFSTLLLTGTKQEWDRSLVDSIMMKLKTFNPGHKLWHSNGEENELVSYDKVRKHEAKRLGVTFIGMSKED